MIDVFEKVVVDKILERNRKSCNELQKIVKQALEDRKHEKAAVYSELLHRLAEVNHNLNMYLGDFEEEDKKLISEGGES